MNIWIFQTGEPLHCDEDGSRPMRAMNLANFLVSRGHKVIIWSSNFYHQKSKHRFNKDKTIRISNLLTIELVSSPGYKNNISIFRLYDHFILGIRFLKKLKNRKDIPDIGFIGFPPMEVAYFVSRWFKRKQIKYFVDVKDPWPDHLVDAFPKKIKSIIKIIFLPYYLITSLTFRDSDGISAITKSFLDWSLELSDRKKNRNDFVFPLVSMPYDEKYDQKLKSLEWAKRIVKNDASINIFFVGTIGKSFNFEPVLKAAEFFDTKLKKINFIICGDGELKKSAEDKSSSLQNVFFTGWINRSQINALANVCNLSIAPYINNDTFKNTISNKMIDYLSLGLPILTSIDGSGVSDLRDNNTAIIYDENDYKTLVNILEELLLDLQLINKMRTSALETFNTNYSYKIVFENAYKKIIKS